MTIRESSRPTATAYEMANCSCPNYGVMDGDTLSALLERVFAFERQAVSFALQGGEPTLAGLRFCKTFVKLVREKNVRQIPVFLSMQANGLCPLQAEYAILPLCPHSPV